MPRIIQCVRLLMAPSIFLCLSSLAVAHEANAVFQGNAGNPAAGSVLIYNLYTSSAISPQAQNTLISVTNEGETAVGVRLYFMPDQYSEKAVEEFLQLNSQQTRKVEASDIDPNQSGFVIAVAVDPVTGIPINHNFLLGDECIKLASGHKGQLPAQVFTAIFTGALPVENGQAKLAFDGVSYSRAPRMLVCNVVPDFSNGNEPILIVNVLSRNLDVGVPILRLFHGTVFDDQGNEDGFAFASTLSHLRIALSSRFPRLLPGSPVRPGSLSRLKLRSLNEVGLVGAVINYNQEASAIRGAYSGAGNLHGIDQAAASTIIIPLSTPGV